MRLVTRKKYSAVDRAWAKHKLESAPQSLDNWPYTATFDATLDEFNRGRLVPFTASELWAMLLTVRKAGLDREDRASSVASPVLTLLQRAKLRELLPTKRGEVDRLPYSSAFDSIATSFNHLLASPIESKDIWRAVLGIVKSKIRKEAKPYFEKSVNLLRRLIEVFNSANEIARTDEVLVCSHHAIEILMKAVLVQRKVAIYDADREQNYSFDKCLSLCINDGRCRCIDENEARTLRALDTLRGASYHDLVELDETELYLFAISSVRLFDRLLREVFGYALADYLPSRVMPLCAIPFADIHVLLDRKEKQIRDLLRAGEHSRARAATLATLAIEKAAATGEVKYGLTPEDVRKCISEIKSGRSLSEVFPNLSLVQIGSDGAGPTIQLSVKGKRHLAIAGTDHDGSTPVVAIERPDYAITHNLSHPQLAQKCGVTSYILTGVLRELKLPEDQTCCHWHGRAGSKKSPGFSAKAVQLVRKFVSEYAGDLKELARKHHHRAKAI